MYTLKYRAHFKAIDVFIAYLIIQSNCIRYELALTLVDDNVDVSQFTSVQGPRKYCHYVLDTLTYLGERWICHIFVTSITDIMV